MHLVQDILNNFSNLSEIVFLWHILEVIFLQYIYAVVKNFISRGQLGTSLDFLESS